KSKGYSWDMGENGGERGVYFLTIIAILVLVIAWVNFINLSTARAVKRAHEVGIRKVIGAGRRQLILQFLLEASALNLLAILIAVALVVGLTPILDKVLGITLEQSLLLTPTLLKGLGGLWLVGSLVSGLYPALLLSAFHPLRVLKGNFYQRRTKLGFRQVLVTLQFSISMILILGTIVVVRQLQFMQGQDLGLNLEQTLVIKGPTASQDREDLRQRKNVFRDQLEQLSAVRGLTLSSVVPGVENFGISDFTTQQVPDVSHQSYIVHIDEHYFENFGIPLLHGRDFRQRFQSDSNAVVLNRTAAKLFGFDGEEAIGQRLNPNSRWEHRVVGIVEDYHHSSFKESLDPILFIYSPGSNDYFSLKLGTQELYQTIADIESIWEGVYPDNPFDFFFLDEFFDRQYKSDRQFNKVFTGFALLAIVVACMGLFGLVSFTVEQSRKEIGIRKVLGAPLLRLIVLFLRDYAWMIGVSMVIAFPLGYYFMTRWLHDFAYPIQLHPIYFVVSALAIILIAVATVGFKSFQAANSNPVESLREE
ncbi:MAG: FtsX-like permease family protein, partial [Bacteroidota bacterium]